MKTPADSGWQQSPFHSGEQQIQSRLGIRSRMEQFGRQVIRSYMPDQHRQFYHQLPYLFVGHADHEGWPWASILCGEAGFIGSQSPTRLSIAASPIEGDPLNQALRAFDYTRELHIGVLGIELASRRRNRLSARLLSESPAAIELEVDQAFGNCPQYIQTRELHRDSSAQALPPRVESLNAVDKDAIALIENADTFFVASSGVENALSADTAPSEGIDVSHRGGRAGFVRVETNGSLLIPDYAGNYHFNTLGNFLINPRAGLLFVDFERGHLLSLTGTAEILWDAPEQQYFEGAERLWRFTPVRGVRISHGLPLRWALREFSPNSLLTGSWKEADSARSNADQSERWNSAGVVAVVEESSGIRSFHLKLEDGCRPPFVPGQFLTLRAQIDGREQIRTYTVSSAPADELLRISVKREDAADGRPAGLFSGFMHRHIRAGSRIDIRMPRGAFAYTSEAERPALLIAAGVGITPMVSMLRHALNEGIRTRSMRQLVLVSAARNAAQRAFDDELKDLCARSGGHIRYLSVLSQPESWLQTGSDFDFAGHICGNWLQKHLPDGEFECYLCGPGGFMQAIYDDLLALGVPDKRIFAESFGPSQLHRSRPAGLQSPAEPRAALQAVVEFSGSGVEQGWTREDGSLLDFAENHGLQPNYGCRSGQCGSCKARLLSGRIAYLSEASGELGEDEVLLCCAVPAQEEGGDGRVVIEL